MAEAKRARIIPAWIAIRWSWTQLTVTVDRLSLDGAPSLVGAAEFRALRERVKALWQATMGAASEGTRL